LDVCKQLGNAVEPSTLLTLYAAKGTVHFLLSEFLPAAQSYQHMLEVARLLGDGAREAEALYLIGNSFLWAHEFEKALQHAEQVKALALAGGFKNSLAAGLYLIGKIHLVLGNLESSSGRFELEEARRCFEEALKLSEEAGDKLLEGFIRFDLVIYHGWKGDYDRALQFQEQATAIGQSRDLALVLLWTSWTGGLCYGGKGEYQKALASLQHALKLSEQLGDKVFKCRALNTLGWVYGELYDLETSLRYNQAAVEIAHELGDPELIRYAEINLGTDYLLLGDLDQAQQFLESVHHACQQPGALGQEWAKHRYSQYLAHSLGELWLGRGDSTRALKFADECLRLAESNSAKKNLVKGLRLKGQALCAQRRMSDAEGAFTEALTIAAEIGNPPQLWKTHQALGEFRELQGELEKASSAYANAVGVIEEVASRLEDPALKRTFLSARPVLELRARIERLGRSPLESA
jgi:tetratricopeptide (TPR) repeat protein